MKKALFTGAGVAIITPMHPDGSINFDKLGELLEFQIANGTDAIITCGTTGESATMTHEEHVEVIRYTVEKVGGRIPVIAGTGSNDTDYAIKLSQEAERLGVDGLLVVTPYYNKTSQRGLIRHYTMIADSVNLTIIVYNIPSRTGVTIKPETFAQLCKHPNIVADKEASGNISAVAQIKALCGDDLAIYSGNDDQIVPILSLGGSGVISVLSNVCPKQAHDICQLYFDGKVTESAKLQLELLDLINALFMDVNPIPVKDAMNLMGMEVGECRMPLLTMDDQQKSALSGIMKKHGLLA